MNIQPIKAKHDYMPKSSGFMHNHGHI